MNTARALAGSRRTVAAPRPEAPPVTRATVVLDLQGVSFRWGGAVRRSAAGSERAAMTSRWIWLVPSKIWITLASRM